MRPLPGDVLRLSPRFSRPDLLPRLPRFGGAPRARRAANARHQRSEEGRRDHRDHVRAWRRRIADRARTSVTDTGPQKLASSAKWAAPTAHELALQAVGHRLSRRRLRRRPRRSLRPALPRHRHRRRLLAPENPVTLAQESQVIGLGLEGQISSDPRGRLQVQPESIG
jgi:hypothetical protein